MEYYARIWLKNRRKTWMSGQQASQSGFAKAIPKYHIGALQLLSNVFRIFYFIFRNKHFCFNKCLSLPSYNASVILRRLMAKWFKLASPPNSYLVLSTDYLSKSRSPKKKRNKRAVRKVSVHFEYLENRSRGLDVTWQQVSWDFTVHPLRVTLLWGKSVGSETPLTVPVYCVTVAFTNLHPFNGDFSFGKSQKPHGAKSRL